MKNNCVVGEYAETDLQKMIEIWSEVVAEGNAFPQEELLNAKTGKAFFAAQTYCGVAKNSLGEVCGLYILHPNNIGRCSHICNASYAVKGSLRGLHIGEMLVKDCLKQAKARGFGILQFNAVVAQNIHARHLYERLGFVQLGTIPNGFKNTDKTYSDICPYYRAL